MFVYFIRHGESECNRLELNCGWAQCDLSPLGHEQARHAHEYLKDIPFDRIYCSDLKRAMQTAEDALPGSEKMPDARLREISVGSLSYVPIAENREKYGEQYEQSCREQDFSAYGGESQQEMAERVRGFIRDELENLQGMQHVAVFGHEGTVHQMICHALGYEIGLDHLFIENAGITVFQYEKKNWRMLQFSYVGDFNRLAPFRG